MIKFEELPMDVQEKIKQDLKAFDECHVVYEYGKYNVGGGICLKSKYADDFEVIGTYYAKDIFTEEERIINYVESFHDYPIQYKGKRDYIGFIKKLTSWNDKVKFDEMVI